MSARLSPSILPQIWLKAAILGSLWASVEIVLGSFLHNIHMPLSGTFLAAIGVIVMINGYKLWPEPGLFWRTAMVTALMKSISPSAIIFGPMVGIFMEGVILEISLRLFRRHWVGFILGGALAVSWSLFQKILVMLMTYGPDFITLYEQLYMMASKTLSVSGTVPVDLVKIIFLIDLSFGAMVALVAWRTKILSADGILDRTPDFDPEPVRDYLTASKTQPYSLGLLLANLFVLVLGLNFLDELPDLVSLGCVMLYILLSISRYARSLKRLKRPQIWIQLFALMVLSGFILGGWQDWASILQGLQTGLNMATRALLVIFTFSALSIELRNPLVIDWFTQRGWGVLFESVSLAFGVLPYMLKLVSTQNQAWRHPFRTLRTLLGALEDLRLQHVMPPGQVIILSGEQGAGKTEFVRALLDTELAKTIDIQGILTVGTWIRGERDQYSVRDIQDGAQALLCERSDPRSDIQAGPFNFRRAGLELGLNALERASQAAPDLVIIDEVGHLEIRAEGWAKAMDKLVARGQLMLWTVRPSLLDIVTNRWPIAPTLVMFDDTNIEDLEKLIRTIIASSK